MESAHKLILIIAFRTLVWAVFAGAILAVPCFTLAGRLDAAAALLVLVLVSGEVLVILLNRGRCPLTEVAARHTRERRDNFDIYLPLGLARWNKEIFGVLYVMGLLYTAAAWAAGRGR